MGIRRTVFTYQLVMYVTSPFPLPLSLNWDLNTTFSGRSSLTSRSQEKERSQILVSLAWLSEFILGTHKSLIWTCPWHTFFLLMCWI